MRGFVWGSRLSPQFPIRASHSPSVEKFFDYKAFGKYIGDAYYGEFVDGGFIYNDTDTSLLDILYQDEPMTMGGM